VQAVHIKDADVIAATIAEVQDLTRQIETGIGVIDDLIQRRLVAINRMLVAADLHVLLADHQKMRGVLTASEPTPPFMPELVSLAVYEAGDDGATLPFIRSRLRERLGLKIDPSLIERTLKTLAGDGYVLDRGTRFFAPISDLARGTRNGSPPIKSLIVEAMERGPREGMAVAKIRDAIAERHDRSISLPTLHAIVRQLERAGRVVKTGHKRALPERSESLEND
jgi:hypothetical protein